MDFEFLIGIAFFAAVYGIFHLYVRRKERLALIEKGQTAAIFNIFEFFFLYPVCVL